MGPLFQSRWVEPKSKDLVGLKRAFGCHHDGSFRAEGGETAWGDGTLSALQHLG
jgi:hypothetical protein